MLQSRECAPASVLEQIDDRLGRITRASRAQIALKEHNALNAPHMSCGRRQVPQRRAQPLAFSLSRLTAHTPKRQVRMKRSRLAREAERLKRVGDARLRLRELLRPIYNTGPDHVWPARVGESAQATELQRVPGDTGKGNAQRRIDLRHERLLARAKELQCQVHGFRSHPAHWRPPGTQLRLHSLQLGLYCIRKLDGYKQAVGHRQGCLMQGSAGAGSPQAAHHTPG